MGFIDRFPVLASAPPADAQGRAWVLLAVIALVIVALSALILVTLIRYLARRSEARAVRQRGSDASSPSVSPWSAAGERAEPVDTSELRGDDDG